MTRLRLLILFLLALACVASNASAAGGAEPAYPKGGKWDLRKEQHAHFPLPLPAYKDPGHEAYEGEGASLWEKIKKRAVAI